MVPLCCEIWDFSALADKLGIWNFETILNWKPYGDNFGFVKLIHTENYLLLTGRRICQLNGKN